MITLRRAKERYDNHDGRQAAWLTFYALAADDALAAGFGNLVRFDEVRLPPNGSIRTLGSRDSETITYVLTGALSFEDSLGRSGMLQAGEFRCVTATADVRFSETNASRRDWAHLFQIGLRTSAGMLPNAEGEQKRFGAADRRDRLCLIAADLVAGVLRIRDDALVYSALLHSGQHLVHTLRSERGAWLHVVSGEVAFDDLVLAQGDGVGVRAERSVSFTARAEAEVLLIDVA